jgi:hypothetical protein
MLSVVSHGGFGGAVAAFTPADVSVVVRMIHAPVLFPGDLTGGTGGVGAASLASFLVAVLGFIASEDKDLSEVSLL